MSGARWLLLRGHRALWAVRSDRVRGVEAAPAGVRIHLDGHVLAAEQVLAAAVELKVVSGGAVARSVMPPGFLGFALHTAGPVVVVDAQAPPAALLAVATASRLEDEEDHDVVRGE